MTGLVANQVAKLLPRAATEYLVVAEVPAAVGIADIVAVRFDRAAVKRRLAAGAGPICSPLRIRVLSLLRSDRGMALGTLAQRVGSNPRALTRSTLNPLRELGLLVLRDDAVFSTGVWRSPAAHVSAVELKLSDWRGALRQADNFAMSADRSWVVLDAKHATSAVRATDTFQAFGVGLAVISGDGALAVVSKPTTRRCVPWLRSLMAEHAWAAAEAEVAATVS